MTEQELRTLVRDAIARVQSARAGDPAHLSHLLHLSHPSHLLHLSHPSHVTFTVPSGADADGPCIIEPAVLCNHCGYCKSMGH
jgi:hypothetical protein